MIIWGQWLRISRDYGNKSDRECKCGGNNDSDDSEIFGFQNRMADVML